MSATLSIDTDDTGVHTATMTYINDRDGSIATGVTTTFTGDNDAVASIDASSGVLTFPTPKIAGVVNLTGTGTRDANTARDSGVLTVTPGDPNKGTFTATLGLS